MKLLVSQIRITLVGVSLLVSGLMCGLSQNVASGALLKQNDRYLEVQQVEGNVTYGGRPARVGDRISTAGEGISTGSRSSAVLTVDNGIGTINLSERSNFQVQSLYSEPGGGKVTLLALNGGQARVKVRRFKNSGSRLQIKTPAGVAGVRGTEFGVAVSPQGKTQVGTLEGTVAVAAQQQTVLVQPNYASVVIPGKPPTTPRLLDKTLHLGLQSLLKAGHGQARVLAKVDLSNSVYFNNRLLDTRSDGALDTIVPVPSSAYIQFVVRDPLGRERVYPFFIP